MKNLTESEKTLSNESSNGILEIRKYPDPVLKKISEPVTVFDDELEDFVKVLFSSMRVHDGVGLAAPQVGVLKKIAVVEYDGDMIVIDAGLMFPDDQQPGIDLVLPDYTYVLENEDKLPASALV